MHLMIKCCATEMHVMRILMHLIVWGINTQSIINYINRNANRVTLGSRNGALSQRKSSTGGIYLKIPPNHNKQEVLHLNSQGGFVITLECVNAGSLIRVQVVRERPEVSSFTLSFNFFNDLTLGSHF